VGNFSGRFPECGECDTPGAADLPVAASLRPSLSMQTRSTRPKLDFPGFFPAKTFQRHPWQVHAYCLMPDRYHLAHL
jgi:hypothetical protein